MDSQQQTPSPRPLTIQERLAGYVHTLSSLGYDTHVSSPTELMAGSDCPWGGRYYLHGTKLCIDGTCHQCDTGNWRDLGTQCPTNGHTC